MDRFPRAFALLRVHEGGYSNHPADPGGATMKGITQRTYDADRRRRGLPTQSVRNITDAEVEAIYRGQYWNTVRADDLPPGVAYCVFDAAVNSGPGRAARWLQECLGVPVDGVIGSETVAAAIGADWLSVIGTYCNKRLAFMKRLKTWGTFGKGWSRRVNEVRVQSLAWAADADVPETTVAPQPKAEGKESAKATAKDVLTDPRAMAAISGAVGSSGALLSGNGPVQYAIAAVLVIAALAGVWWLVKGRK
ncbi:glycoside hydrolase family 108 protein [Roseovarius amoyensis]|uniref:glycoside hydrolase family 108 protein n=1 Tax=Roseovarius amoyensis TaxID=2211448 RepID=UPI000DBE1D24|nr:glycoside hydrolase family 108 protein [Roseovarius amoyensis]